MSKSSLVLFELSSSSSIHLLLTLLLPRFCRFAWAAGLGSLFSKITSLALDQQANNEAKETQDGAENLNDEDLDEERAVGGISQCSARAVDAHGHAADEIASTNGEASPEEGEAGVVRVGVGQDVIADVADFGREDDGHDDAVDGDDLAEDNADQVLGADTRCLDAGAEDGRARDENAPVATRSANEDGRDEKGKKRAYHAAPTTDRPMQRAIPREAQVYGDTDSRKAPT